MIRPLLSSKRLFFDETAGKVRYQHSREGSQQMDYLDIIARVTSHIPDKGQVIIRYYGLYSNLLSKSRRSSTGSSAISSSHLKLYGHLHHVMSNRNSWWQPRREESISESDRDCLLLIWGSSLSWTWRFGGMGWFVSFFQLLILSFWLWYSHFRMSVGRNYGKLRVKLRVIWSKAKKETPMNP